MKKEIEDWFYIMLENESLEEIFERFDVDAIVAFQTCLENGLIDEEVLERMAGLG